MSELVRVCLDDVVYLLQLPPFNYIVGAFLLSICIFTIYSIVERR